MKVSSFLEESIGGNGQGSSAGADKPRLWGAIPLGISAKMQESETDFQPVQFSEKIDINTTGKMPVPLLLQSFFGVGVVFACAGPSQLFTGAIPLELWPGNANEQTHF